MSLQKNQTEDHKVLSADFHVVRLKESAVEFVVSLSKSGIVVASVVASPMVRAKESDLRSVISLPHMPSWNQQKAKIKMCNQIISIKDSRKHRI